MDAQHSGMRKDNHKAARKVGVQDWHVLFLQSASPQGILHPQTAAALPLQRGQSLPVAAAAAALPAAWPLGAAR